VSKPPAGTSCPAGSAFTLGTQADLRNADGSPTWTPIGVNQTDTDLSGWLLGSEFPETGSADALALFQVTDNGNGTASVQTTGTALTVPSFSIPANAIQGRVRGTKLDTMDTRLTQAVSAIDPSRSGVAIWTQHTVFGGAGAEVRWYEINPSGPSLFQSGTLSNSNLFVFNAAISPDRLLNGSTTAFGDSMGIGFTTSSIYTDASLWVASKTGDDALSPWVMVRQSPGPNIDRSCSPCRWGDYMGATPDPGADPLGDHGAVWMTSMWNAKSTNDRNFDWRTMNWETDTVPNSSTCTMIGTPGPDFLTGSGGADVLCGGDGDDILLGGNGNDELLGGTGNDLLVPEGGNDAVDGESGQDFVDYETTRVGVSVDLAARVAKGQGTDRLTSIEDAVGSTGSDRLRGTGAGNALYGLGGTDALYGGAGRDYLNGGPGNDFLDGQDGSDRCVTGGGTDTKVSCER
jgi:Ca2+-binding RTX toxin-like protein